MPAELMLHCGGLPATFEEVCNIDVPPSTSTYRPVPHGDIVRLVEEEMHSRFRLAKPERHFGLNREGQQMFGVLKYDLFNDQAEADIDRFIDSLKNEQTVVNIDAVRQYGLSIGLRNAYDKSISVGIAGGVHLFVCDNLCFRGDSFTVLRRHTPKVWDDLVPMVMTNVRSIDANFAQAFTWQEGLKDHAIDTDRGYEIIGLARGRSILTPTQSNVALDEWRGAQQKDEHTFAEFRDTSYALYQGFTHALKLGHVGRKIDEYTGATQLFDEVIEH